MIALNQSKRTRATGIGSLLRRLARRSLKPQLNQIRTWVRQGRTDAWIAHQLEVSVGDIRSFKREHELVPGEGPGESEDSGASGSEELDLRAEDDALVAAALEAEQEADEEAPDEEAPDEEAPGEDERGTTTTTRSPSAAGAGVAAGAGAAGASSRRSRARSTTATRATGSGSTQRSRTTPSTPSTGPATAP